MKHHTPAPWHVSNDDVYYYRVFDDKHYCIASCGKEKIDKANACVIAAGPELLEALEYALTFLESLPKGWLAKTSGDVGALNDFYLTAPKAIAKAKGELK